LKDTEGGAKRRTGRASERTEKVMDKGSGRSKTVKERRRSQGDPINMRVYRAVMPVVAAYLLDTHLNLDRNRPDEPREKPHTSRLPGSSA